MIIHKSIIIIILYIVSNSITYAQKVKQKQKGKASAPIQETIYNNHIYLSSIRTITNRIDDNEQSIPIYTLGATNNITFSFDDLRADRRSIYYKIIHCNKDWKPSQLASMDYVIGINEALINDVYISQNTLIPYSHYAFTFPSENITPKIGGNYLLKVYENADERRLLFTKKIFVVNPKSTVKITNIPTTDIKLKHTHQKLDIEVTPLFQIDPMNSNFQLSTLQNNIPLTEKSFKAPSRVDRNTLYFYDINTFSFEGGNEFRTLDLRTFQSSSSQVKSIQKDSIYRINLISDEDISDKKYEMIPDNNGRFYIRSNTNHHSDYQNDYANITFEFIAPKEINGKIYLIGGFNSFILDESSQLFYNDEKSVWQNTQILKEGIYNYQYIFVQNNVLELNKFSGNHYQTENEYHTLVYYRKPGTYWDEIIGYSEIKVNSNHK